MAKLIKGKDAHPEGDYGAAAQYYPAPVEIEEDGFDLKQIIAVLRRRKKIIIFVAILGTVLGAGLGLSRTAVYTAKAEVLIEGQNNVANLNAVVAGIDPAREALESQIRLITSTDFLERLVIEKFQNTALVEYEQSLQADPKRQILNAMPEDWRITLGLEENELLKPVSVTKEEAFEFKLAQVAQNLSVKQAGRSNVLAISYESTSNGQAAQIANAAAELYIREQRERKRAGTTQASKWLEERVVELEQDLRFAEQQIEDYRIENNISGQDQVSVDTSKMMNLTTMLIESRTERQDKAVRLRYIQDLRSQDDNLQSLSEIIGSPLMFQLVNQDALLDREIAELLAIYGPQHPKVLDAQADKDQLSERVRQETENMIRNLSNEISVLQGREASIQGEINSLEGASDQSAIAQIELRSLESQADATRRLYENFLQRLREVEEQESIVEADARIIESARTPTKPSSPGALIFTAAGFTAASMLGLLLAFGRERLDNSVRSGKELEQEFGVPALGLVPYLKRRESKGHKPHEYLLAKPLSIYTETIRQIYTNLRLQSVGDQALKVIQLTSSVPAEGKTTLAVSLAAGLAQAGSKVVLVDLDMRHPSVSRELPGTRNGRLLDYLMGDCSIHQLAQSDEALGFDAITLDTKTKPANPSRLLAADHCKEMMVELRSRYDYVIVDSPPVLGVSDCKLIMEMADTVVFVVKWEQTSFDVAADAFKELQSVGADIAGVVVTQVDTKKHAGYGYGGIDNYYSKYNSYYNN